MKRAICGNRLPRGTQVQKGSEALFYSDMLQTTIPCRASFEVFSRSDLRILLLGAGNLGNMKLIRRMKIE